MFFDLTSEILLNKKSRFWYRFFQIILYLGALAIGIFLISRLLFPIGFFEFSFLNFNSTKNTLSDPRNSQGNPLSTGIVSSENKMVFDASLVGKYSQATIDFDLNDKSADLNNGKISIYRSYRSFLLPEGEPIGFQNGSWIRNEDNFFFVSGGKLFSFASKTILSTLEFPEEKFLSVEKSDLNYNSPGGIISADYPLGTVFQIDDEYYFLKEKNELKKFVSREAFLSQHPLGQFVVKDKKFLDNYSVSEELLGFSGGSLIAYGESAFVVNGQEILPIGDPSIFLAAGFSWDDLIPVSGEEISLYKKGKLFSLSSVHPDGTVFFAKDSGKYYLISNGQKEFLPTEKIATSWIHTSPIKADISGLDIFSDCHLSSRKIDWGKRTYTCQTDLEKLQNLSGKDYEFVFILENEVKIDRISATFKRSMNKDNFWQSVYEIINRIKNNYVK